jgi:RNA-directed DNA polymerase
MIALDLSLENLYRQYHACRRNKRNTHNALHFEVEQEKHLIDLREALVNRTYRPGRSVCFFATKPKLREIFAADFRDRVVHHLLVDYLEKIWEPVFIHDSYACRKGKGVHAGVQRLQTFLRQATANGTRPAWFLQLDIHNYFMRIDKDILFGLLAARLRDETALWLAHMLVYHDCTTDYVLRGNPALREAVPPHKTLFGTESNKGLPIGNLNSQFFANVYLNRLDQFVKHELKCRHYLRYCDDFVLLANDPDTLRDWRVRIEDFLRMELALELNPKQRLAPVSNGIDFLGYIVRRDYLLVRRRVVNNLKTKLHACETRLVREQDGVRAYRFDETELDALAATLSSYLGHFRLANSWNLWQSLWAGFPFLAQYFEFDAGRWRLVRKYPVPAGLDIVRRQYRYFRWRFPEDALLFRVGRFYEFYDIRMPPWLTMLGLKRMRWNRRGARYGFPAGQLDRYLGMLLSQHKTILLFGEQENSTGGICRRTPLYRFVPG